MRRNIKPEISNLKNDAAKTVCEKYSYLQLTLCVNFNEDISKDKTIYKAKGDELEMF